MKTLFISRDVKTDGPLSQFCKEKEIQLIAESLIDFKIIIAPDFPKTDVIFFTSPRSVNFFLIQSNILEKQLIATVGERTAQELESRGYQVDFIGKTPTQPELVAQDFSTWLGEKTVLFPQSNRSNQTIQKQLNPNQCVNREVYKTILLSKTITPQPDILIFSSPSNAEAYLNENTIYTTQRVLAFGSSTATFLNSKQIPNQLVDGIMEKDIVMGISRMV